MLANDNHLIVGADSLIGSALLAKLISQDTTVIGTTKKRQAKNDHLFLDLTQDSTNWTVPSGVTVAYLFAAITSLDYCRKYPKESYLVNVKNTIKLIDKLIAKNVYIVFASTSLVFNGEKPFRQEIELTSPFTQYGHQKAIVEDYILSKTAYSSIIRMTKIAESLKPLLENWLVSLAKFEPIYPFKDMVCAPVSIDYCIDAIQAITKNRLSGIIHISGHRDIAYEQICSEMVKHKKINNKISKKYVCPLMTREMLPDVESVPSHTTLKPDRVNIELNIDTPNSWETIYKLLNTLVKSNL